MGLGLHIPTFPILRTIREERPAKTIFVVLKGITVKVVLIIEGNKVVVDCPVVHRVLFGLYVLMKGIRQDSIDFSLYLSLDIIVRLDEEV